MANLSNINNFFVVEQTTGYVGIGITDPAFPLEVKSASAELALNATGGSIYRVRSTASDEFIITKNGVGDRLTISGGGDATFAGGIGLGGATIANSYMIEITAAGGNIIRSTRGSSVFAAYQSNNSHVYLGTTSNNEFKLIQNDGVALTIDTSKNATFTGRISLSDRITFTGISSAKNVNIITDETNTGTGTMRLQAGGGSAAYGGGLNLYANAHATLPGCIRIGISSGSGGWFGVNTQGGGTGSDVLRVYSNAMIYNVNTQGSTWFGQDAGLSQVGTLGSYNTLYGFNAGKLITTGARNTIIGGLAGDAGGTNVLNYNVIIGSYAGSALANTSNSNVIIGDGAGASSTGMGSSVLIGQGTGDGNTGNSNVFIGYNTAPVNTSGQRNIAIGNEAMRYNITGIDVVAIGYRALYSDASIEESTAVGSQALYSQTSGRNHAFGFHALQDLVDGTYNTAVGGEAMENVTSGSNNVGVGIHVLRSLTTGGQNTAVGYQAMYNLGTLSNNTAVGYQALYSTTTDGNTAFGYHAGLSTSTGGSNTFIGQQCHALNQTGYGNTSVGMQCGYNGTGGIQNTYMGYAAGYGQTGTGGNYNTAIGFYASKTIGAATVHNTSLGYYAGGGYGAGVLSGAANTALGSNAALILTSGGYNTIVGHNAGNVLTSHSYNTAVGHESMVSFTGQESVAIGNYTLRLTTTSDQVAVGYAALYGGTLGAGNTAVGYRCGQLRTGGAHNVFMGGYAAYAAGTGDYNVAIGVNAAYSMTSGTKNTIIGREAGFYLTSAWDCIAIGKNALQGNSGGMTGANNTAIGIEALAGVSSSVGNIAIGHSAGFSVSTGSGCNIFLGNTAGYNTSTGSNNILIGWNTGRTGSQTPPEPQSMGGVSTGSNQIQIGNESHTHAIVQVTWTINSDGRDKTEIKELDLGLEFVNKLKPITYKWDKRSKYEDLTPDGTHTEEKLQIGFVAQDIIELEKEYGYTIENKTNLATWESEDKWKVGIQHANLIPSLVKAIQELKAEIEILKSK